MTRAIATALSLACLIGPQAVAQDATPAPQVLERFYTAAGEDAFALKYAQRLHQQAQRSSKRSLLQSLYQQFYHIAPDGVMTVEAIERHTQTQQARQRSGQLSKYLNWDLDADGTLSKAERDIVATRDRADIELLFVTGDTNRDGVIDLPEMIAFAQNQISENDRQRRETPFTIFDTNLDGTVTVEEISTVIDALIAFDYVTQPSPQNRTITIPGSPLDGTTRQQLSEQFSDRPTCNAPRPDAAEQMVVLTGYEGTALSTVSVAGMDDVTQVASIVVEEGTKPLYIYLSSYENMIWRFSGATDRVQTLVVQKGHGREGAGAGVIGIDGKKVHFVDSKTCSASYLKVSGDDGAKGYETIARNLGRNPDVLLYSYSIATMSLPSGKGTSKTDEDSGDILILNGRRYEMTPQGPRLMDETEGQLPDDQPFGATLTFKSMIRFNPDGVLAIDKSQVVAPAPVQNYDVLPEEAGLLQLLLEGKLTYTRAGYYIINEPIARFPAGLAGAHSVKFILGEGVEMPKGNAGHSSIYSAETRECISRICLQ